MSVGKMRRKKKIGLRMEELSSGCAEQNRKTGLSSKYTTLQLIYNPKREESKVFIAVVDKTPTQHTGKLKSKG